jgi:putative tryptophan/tyrosine transport system substrate-binding protein
MQRREFIGVLGAAAAWSLAARAQQIDRVRRIGVLMGLSEGDPGLRGLVGAFIEELAKLGWIDGRNAQIEQRWTNADIKLANALAKELLTTPPDVILASTTPATAALHGETSIVPIVFAIVSDPVGAGFVASFRRPGGNITGFTQTDAALGGKWLSLLKEIAPGIKHAAIMFNPDTAPNGGNLFLGSFEAAARLLTVEPLTVPVRSDAEIETAIAALGRERAGL